MTQTITLAFPDAVYNKLSRAAQLTYRSIVDIVITTVEAALAADAVLSEGMRAEPLTMPSEFALEVAAFDRIRPTLQEQYGGQVVAIYQGDVVAVGSDKMAVLAQVQAEYGSIPCYIEWVEPETPRRARVTSAWIKQ